MSIPRAIPLFLSTMLLLTFGVAANAQRCNRPAPPGQYMYTHTSPRTSTQQVQDQQIVEAMARGTYGYTPGMPGTKNTLSAERSEELQRVVTIQSAQLLALAQRLNTDASSSSNGNLSATLVKEAAQIQKLAKSIKSKMKDGY